MRLPRGVSATVGRRKFKAGRVIPDVLVSKELKEIVAAKSKADMPGLKKELKALKEAKAPDKKKIEELDKFISDLEGQLSPKKTEPKK
jgi:hypothetical protein